MDLRYVEKILPLPLLKTIPASPIYCAGLMNRNNQCVPVIDLALSVGLTRNQIYPLNIPILLCTEGAHQIGLIVDKVLGLGDIDEEKIEIHEEFISKNSPFSGAVPLETGVALLVNPSWLFALKLTQDVKPS